MIEHVFGDFPCMKCGHKSKYHNMINYGTWKCSICGEIYRLDGEKTSKNYNWFISYYLFMANEIFLIFKHFNIGNKQLISNKFAWTFINNFTLTIINNFIYSSK